MGFLRAAGPILGGLALAVPVTYSARILVTVGRAHAREAVDDGSVDLLIVPGAAQFDGRPGATFSGRLRHALELYEASVAAGKPLVLCVLGGKLPGDRMTEGEAGVQWLSERGVPAAHMVAVSQGHDTRFSLTLLRRRLAGQDQRCHRPALIVSDPLHVLRCRILASRVGFANVDVAPTPYCPAKPTRPDFWWAWVHEVGGLMITDISGLLGRGVAREIEDVLRQFQVWLRPSRRARYEQLRRDKKSRDHRDI